MFPPIHRARPNDSLETMRARLAFQSKRRGTLESELILGTFAKEHLHSMSEIELRELDRMMDESDLDIYCWVAGTRSPPERWTNSPLLEKLRDHVREGKVARRAPEEF